MRDISIHQQLASELEHSHEQVRGAISGLTDEEAYRPGPDGWSIKDHLTHMTLWHEMRFFEIGRIARGGQPSFPVSGEERINPLNDVNADNRRSLSLAQVIEDLEFAWQMVGEAVAACSGEQLERGFSGEMGPVGTAHDIDHAGMIRTLRQ